jgi:hypothetical protein
MRKSGSRLLYHQSLSQSLAVEEETINFVNDFSFVTSTHVTFSPAKLLRGSLTRVTLSKEYVFDTLASTPKKCDARQERA